MTMPVDMMFKMLEWALSGDTGASSKTMMQAALRPLKGGDIPHDSGDFGRCYRLIKNVPELRGYFPQMKVNCPRISPYLDEWDDLCFLYERGMKNADRKAPELYARLKELSDLSMTAAGFVKTAFGWIGQREDDE